MIVFLPGYSILDSPFDFARMSGSSFLGKLLCTGSHLRGRVSFHPNSSGLILSTLTSFYMILQLLSAFISAWQQVNILLIALVVTAYRMLRQ